MDELVRLLSEPPFLTRAELLGRLGGSPAELDARLDALRAQGYRLAADGEARWSIRPTADSLLPGDILASLTTRRFGRGELLYALQMGSTNQELKRAAAAEALPEGSLAVCDRQTAGRGRMQRAWDDPNAGESLTCSLLLRPALSPEKLSLLTLATAVAIAETIAELGLNPGIKWPNDVVLSGRKCVGILCETIRDPAGALCVVVGTGVNVRQAEFPEALRDRATSLRLEGAAETDRRKILCSYLANMERVTDALEKEGLGGLLPAYTARSVTLGRRVQVIGPGETFTGMAERMDDTGALFVRDDAGTLRRVLSGDVSVRGVMGYV